MMHQPIVVDVPQDRSTEPTFEVGRLVVLRSGGPLMTVHEIHQEMATVDWFIGPNLLQAVFPTACLQVVIPMVRPETN